MNTAFNIPPEDNNGSSSHLLVEAGSYGISFIWFSKSLFSVKGLAMYTYGNAEDWETEARQVLESHAAHFQKIASVTISYDYRESILIPGRFADPVLRQEALSLLFGNDAKAPVNDDVVTSLQVHNYYRVPKQLAAVLAEYFPRADIFHSTSLQLEQLNNSNELIYCVVFHNVVKVILYKEGRLRLVQQFQYAVPSDLAYHLLNVCEQHGLKPVDLQLRLTGMIDEHSKLYGELFQYFSKIDFDDSNSAVYEPASLRTYPPHFFSHLTGLALCVS